MPTPPYLIPTLLARLSRDPHDVELLYACESGSRAWGLASTDSDYDVRFVYRHPREWYLSLHPGRDMIGPHIERDGELDLAGWDVRKFLHHLSNSNPNILEWLVSPIVYHATDTLPVSFAEETLVAMRRVLYEAPLPLPGVGGAGG